MIFDPEVWGPHYWFFLHTIAHSYPNVPNDVTKENIMISFKIYRCLYQTVLANNFSHMLDKYPVTPYLDNKDSFKKWMHFI